MITKVRKIEDFLSGQFFLCQVWLPLSLRGAIMKMLSFLGSILEYFKCGGGLSPRGRWFKKLNLEIFFVFQAGIISLHNAVSCISGRVSCWFTHRFTANRGTKGSMWTASRFGVYEENVSNSHFYDIWGEDTINHNYLFLIWLQSHSRGGIATGKLLAAKYGNCWRRRWDTWWFSPPLGDVEAVSVLDVSV